MNHHDYMTKVLELAKTVEKNEIPVAAIIVANGEIIAQATNTRESETSILGHAEINVMQATAKLRQDWNLSDCILYVNLEPCAMCAGAILQSHIPEVVFGAYDVKSGAMGSRYNLVTNNLKVTGGVMEEECVSLLSNFFMKIRN
jgi:tRNA(adenine34) deaminase